MLVFSGIVLVFSQNAPTKNPITRDHKQLDLLAVLELAGTGADCDEHALVGPPETIAGQILSSFNNLVSGAV
jgi:hypothetical protein